MLRTKKIMLNAVLLSLLSCTLTINTVFADVNNNSNPNSNNIPVVSEQNQQNTEELLNSYLDAANNGANIGNPLTSIENLIKAENLLSSEPNNQNLRNKYNLELGNFYSRYEQFENALNAFNKISTTDNNQKLLIFKQKAWYYNSLMKFNEAKHELKNLQNLITKEYTSYPQLLFDYNVDYSYFLLDSCQFDEFMKETNKLKTLITKIPAGENRIRAEIELNQLLITYYICKNMRDKAQEVLDTNIKLAEDNNISYKDNTTHFYKDYFYSIKDFKSVKKIIDKEAEQTKLQFSKNSVNLINSYEDYLGYYNNFSENKNKEKYSAKIIELLEPYKNIIPLKYGKAIKIAAEIQSSKGENDKALKYLNEVERYYLKVTSSNSYPFFETTKFKGDIYRNMGENDKALEYYKKAESILKNLQGIYLTRNSYEIERDIAYLYTTKNDFNNALKIINNSIQIAEKIYNKNNVEVQKLNMDKINILNHFEKSNEAEEVFNKISDIIDNNKMEGYDYDFCYQYYTTMIYRNLGENNKDKVRNYIQKAEKYATYKWQKKEIKKLKKELTKK